MQNDNNQHATEPDGKTNITNPNTTPAALPKARPPKQCAQHAANAHNADSKTKCPRPGQPCPECGDILIPVSGCCLCVSCGYSGCS